MEISTLYWLTRVEAFKDFLDGGMVFSMITALVIPFAFLMYSISSSSYGDSTEIKEKKEAQKEGFIKSTKRGFIASISVFVLFGIASVFVPTNKDLAVILGGYYIVNNDELSAMPTKAAKVVNKFMDDYLEDTNK